MLCRGLEKKGMVRAWHGRGMASVNQTWPRSVNQMGKTHSKPLAARHGRGMLYVNRPEFYILICTIHTTYRPLRYPSEIPIFLFHAHHHWSLC